MSGIWGNRDVPWIPPELAEPDGFVGVGGDLRPPTLLRAYADGVFPWFNEGDPILWWSPDPRGIIDLHVDSRTHPDATPGYGGLHVSRRLARTIRSGKFRVTVNQCFETVMRACGECRPEGTWVTNDMLTGYAELHRLGHAHSLETWVRAEREGPDVWELAGGTYGVSIGGLFAAESMFYRVTDGSKVALAALVSRLRERGFTLLDVQMKTDHTSTMGASEISRSEYLKRLRQAIGLSGVRFV
ncbi:leucyl phenylalanyl-trna--protein transferase : Leucyl/phenylalanyl-tRNA--protein transferase OS=Magnetococcus sp. (strain MC-1) GN=aat PE=3 SV=1: Leu_Phe_trans [Gemmata massiliana]|uniref:Leucyl/phenylalanyl-tRNA--protein transferase n=1 Tax=Gemmata massiliana TaxID=1210884 RepID=A0A6P2DJT8_9BACT|nr:leucyl/phenylalanyl-tRNA--protein transferase [Gemmata massiliana]VTS02529.1 leucyl phenylalanyl-trna--protein transferase : Leucyl/phenylalanyl-tRNA--protein transferase OS=Magnetococcus sp. (strain MC-1) GN=aat PE=3 SV=1: Leu_Phe_trans [Gemmata massiliana]